jgi:hypothetical protein
MIRRSRLFRGSGSKRKDRLERANPALKADVSEELLTKAEESAVPSEPTFHEELMSEAEEESVSHLPLLPSDVPQRKEDKLLSLHHVLDTIKKDVQKEFADLGGKKEKLGGFLHELVYLDSPEEVEKAKNIEVAKRLMAEHPMENVLLKVTLHDEPAPEAGLHALVRAEDFLNFENIEVTTPEGAVYTVPRGLVREFVGVAPQSASIEIPKSAEGMGGNGINGDVYEAGEAGSPDEQS